MTGSELPEAVDELVAQWLDAHRQGNRAECAALVAAHPELANEIAGFADDYERIDRRFAALRPIFGTALGSAEMATLGSDDTATPIVPQSGEIFGDYELLSEIARGGMGVVFKARQRSLNRIVALKMVVSGRTSPTDRQRFLAEARAVARLSHPHIVPIYEVNDRDGQHYFTMEYLSGGSLRERLEELRGDPRAIAKLMATVARAVEHAHRRGILHRDLKPSNILLDERREPHVTDFGLAKRLDEESDLTQAGAIVGTPSYMAPEQAEGQNDLTTAVDVYGLGAVLYELLTGRPPFRGSSPMETILAAVSQEPASPSSCGVNVDHDLETICLKCLEKDPLARYGSAEALADDLDRWLAGQPIVARPVTTVEWLVKWARRQPILAGSLATLSTLALALLVVAGFLWQNAEVRAGLVKKVEEGEKQFAQVTTQVQEAEKKKSEAEKLADEQRKLADQQKKLADKIDVEVKRLEKEAEIAKEKIESAKEKIATAERTADRTLYAADMQLAHAAWQGENIVAANELLARYGARTGADDPRGFEWRYLNRLAQGARLTWRDDRKESAGLGAFVGLAISPDGKSLATASMRGQLVLWSLADGKLLKAFDTKPSQSKSIALTNLAGVFFEDDGRKLVAIVRKTYDMQAFDKQIAKSVASKEKLKIESLGESLEYQVFEVAGSKPPVIERFDPKRLRTNVLSSLTGAFFVVNEGQATMVQSMDRSPDGKLLAMAGTDVPVGMDRPQRGAVTGGRIILWDLAKGEMRGQMPTPVPIGAVALSSDGASIAVATTDGAVGIGKIDLAQPPRLMLGHQGLIHALRFSQNGRRLASGGLDGQAIIWDVATGKEISRLRGHIAPVSRLDFSADGESLVSGSLDGVIKVWDVEGKGPLTVLRGHESAVMSLLFAGDGRELLAADMSGAVKTWNLDRGQVAREKKVANIQPLMIQVSPNGKFLAWKQGLDNSLNLRDLENQKDIKLNIASIIPFQPKFSPDSHYIATANLDTSGDILLYSTAGGNALAKLAGVRGSAMGLTFSADGKRIVACASDGVVVWNWDEKKSMRILESKEEMAMGVAISSDGKLVAAAFSPTKSVGPGIVRIFNLEENRLQAELRGAGQEIRQLAFSPDGRRLATAGSTTGQRGILKLWETEGGREVFSAARLEAMITAIAFSSDGNRLAAALTPFDVTASLTGQKVPGEIHIWDATPLGGK